jgi:hypothetical protein
MSGGGEVHKKRAIGSSCHFQPLALQLGGHEVPRQWLGKMGMLPFFSSRQKSNDFLGIT